MCVCMGGGGHQHASNWAVCVSVHVWEGGREGGCG